MRKFLASFFLLFPLVSQAQEFQVVSSAASVRQVPMGQIEKTLNRGDRAPLTSLFTFWGKTKNGWVNLDYTSFNFPFEKVMGELPLKFSIITSPEEIDGLKLNENDVLYVAKVKDGKAVCLFKNRAFLVPEKDLDVESSTFSVIVINRKATLSDGVYSVTLKPGTALLKGNGGYIYRNHFYTSLEPVRRETSVDLDTVLKEINRLVDIFNSAKFSSSLADRLGYYVKTMPVRDQDVELVRTDDGGVGVVVTLRYKFYLKNGEPIEGRKTRLFLKESNYEFWRKLSEDLFKSGVDKFVDIRVYRFNGKDSYEDCGFVDTSYHLYKLGYLKNWKTFLDSSESNLSDDLWFFADEVYERLEDD